MEPNNLDSFFEESENDLDILNQPLTPENNGSDTTDGDNLGNNDDNDEGTGFKARNRREKRLLRQLEAERESNAFMAGKLEAVVGAKTDLDGEADYLKSIERIYGTDTPEALLATDLLKKAIVGARDDAENRAYNRWLQEQQRATQAEKEASDELDGMIEEIEDTYNVELTPAQERSYFQLMEKMSPKDKQGNVIGYADPHAVWEIFKERTTKNTGTNDRAKQLANRSLTGSTSADSNLKDDSTERFLRNSGII